MAVALTILAFLLSVATAQLFDQDIYIQWMIMAILYETLYYKETGKLMAFSSYLKVLSVALSPAISLVIWMMTNIENIDEKYVSKLVRTRNGKWHNMIKTRKKISKYERPFKTLKKSFELVDFPILERFFAAEAEYCCPSGASSEAIFDYEPLDEREVNERLLKLTKDVCYKDIYFFVLVLIFLIHLIGMAHWTVILMPVVLMFISTKSTAKPQDIFKEAPKFEGPDGLYRVYRRGLIRRKLIGVAYAEGGTLYSKKHVCDDPIEYGGIEYGISYISEKDDMISWGGRPRIAGLAPGDSVVVEILPVDSLPTIVFTSTVCGFGSKIAFRSLPTQPGVSGSPIFKIEDNEGTPELKFAGCYGNTINADFRDEYNRPYQIELAENSGQINNTEDMAITQGSYYQVFLYPGYGKTRKLIPEICRQGENIVDRIVVLTPTVVVANEFVASSDLDVGTIFKGGKKPNRAAKIQVMAHATALSLMVQNKFPFRHGRIGFIVDESHVHNSKTLCLLAAIKDRVRREGKGFCVEMSATGEKAENGEVVLETGSNYPIEEKAFSLKDQSFEDHVLQVADNNPGKRIVVFVGQVQGPTESVNSTMSKLRDRVQHRIVPVHRAVFSEGFNKAKEERPEGVVIVTTSVSECGANYNADIVIDSMAQLRYEVIGTDKLIRSRMGTISEAQYIQRRGRVGRRKEGLYYYPLERRNVMHGGLGRKGTAEEFDLQVFQRSLGIEQSEGFRLSAEQIGVWMGSVSENSEGPMNPRTVDLLFTKSGVPYTKQEVLHRMNRSLLNGNLPVKLGNMTLKLQWWDDRDKKHLSRVLALVSSGIQEVDPVERLTISRLYSRRMRTEINGLNPSLVANGIPLEYVAEYGDVVKVKSMFTDTLALSEEEKTEALASA